MVLVKVALNYIRSNLYDFHIPLQPTVLYKSWTCGLWTPDAGIYDSNESSHIFSSFPASANQLSRGKNNHLVNNV